MRLDYLGPAQIVVHGDTRVVDKNVEAVRAYLHVIAAGPAASEAQPSHIFDLDAWNWQPHR